jgi:hypothetical protein
MHMSDPATPLWVLARDGQRFSCSVRLTPLGIEMDLAQDGSVVVTRAFDDQAEALEWAEKKRVMRQSQGWAPVDLPPTSKV